MTNSNPLTLSILRSIRKSSTPQSLVQLVALCHPELKLLIDEAQESKIVLFQKNFFVMNALYQIQKQILNDGYYLSISPVQIELTICSAFTGNSLVEGVDRELSAYYLDWDNMECITADEVNELLDSFWQGYQGLDKKEHALKVLGIESGADWTEITSVYRHLASLNHPDKGGSAQQFIAIREAYETLKIFRSAS